MLVQWPEYIQLNIIQHISGFLWQVFTKRVSGERCYRAMYGCQPSQPVKLWQGRIGAEVFAVECQAAYLWFHRIIPYQKKNPQLQLKTFTKEDMDCDLHNWHNYGIFVQLPEYLQLRIIQHISGCRDKWLTLIKRLWTWQQLVHLWASYTIKPSGDNHLPRKWSKH